MIYNSLDVGDLGTGDILPKNMELLVKREALQPPSTVGLTVDRDRPTGNVKDMRSRITGLGSLLDGLRDVRPEDLLKMSLVKIKILGNTLIGFQRSIELMIVGQSDKESMTYPDGIGTAAAVTDRTIKNEIVESIDYGLYTKIEITRILLVA